MQKKLSSLLILLLILGLSCSKEISKETLHFIPSDAALILRIDCKSLLLKLSWIEIKRTDWFMNAESEETNPYRKKLMFDPGNSGIDLSKDIALFFRHKGPGTFMAVTGSVKNEKNFEEYVTFVDREMVKEKNEMKMMEMKDGVMTWKNGQFIFLSSVKLNKRYNKYGEDTEFPDDSLYKFASELFEMKAEDCILGDKSFMEKTKENGDIKLWMRTGDIYSRMVDEMPKLGLVNLDRLLEGSITTASLNFDDGMISLNAKQYANPQFHAFYSLIASHSIKKELLERIPSENVSFVMACSFPPEMLKEIKSRPANSNEPFSGFDEIAAALGGDILIALTDVKMTTELLLQSGNTGRFPKFFNLLLAARVGEKENFEKLLDLSVKDIEEELESVYSVTKKYNGPWFAMGIDPLQVQKFLDGGSTKQTFTPKLAGHNFGMYLRFNDMLEAWETTLLDDKRKGDVTFMKNTLQDLSITGGKFRNGYVEFEAVLSYKNKQTNSLQQLSRFIDRMSQKESMLRNF